MPIERHLQRADSKIRGDALVLPVAVSGRFWAFRALKFLRHRLGVGFRAFSVRFGLWARARSAAGVSGLRSIDGGAGGEGSSVISKLPARQCALLCSSTHR